MEVHFNFLVLIVNSLYFYTHGTVCLNRTDVGLRSCTSSRITQLDNKVENDRKLWTVSPVRSVTKCSVMCLDDIECVSYSFNNGSKTCRGHSIIIQNSSSVSVEDGNANYYLDDAAGYIGDLCSTSSDCIVDNAECRADCVNITSPASSDCTPSRCWCTSGYSFSPSGHTCTPACTEPGTDFMRTFLHYIGAGSPVDFSNVSLDECKQHCIQATSSLCKSIQYGSISRDCFLLSTTKLDYLDSQWAYDSYTYEYSYYQRDCK